LKHSPPQGWRSPTVIYDCPAHKGGRA
jgi:hypothetical protein